LVRRTPKERIAVEQLEQLSESDEDSDCSSIPMTTQSINKPEGVSPLNREGEIHLVFLAESLEKDGFDNHSAQHGSFHSKHSLDMKFTDVCDS
jgi:hypothetical protein